VNRVKIVYSTECTAGRNLAGKLQSLQGFTNEKLYSHAGVEFKAWEHENGGAELVEVPWRLATECEQLALYPRVFASELVIFASRHRAESGAPCLTTHAPGNFGPDSAMGGRPFELGIANGRANACLLRWFAANPLEGYGVSREATHHGPTCLPWSCAFAELGSTQQQWEDEKAAAHLAQAIEFAAFNYKQEQGEVFAGFGGTHYCPKFGSLEMTGKHCFSHIASKYSLDALTEQTAIQTLEKSADKTAGALVDWKGCSAAQREKLSLLLAKLGVEVKRV